LPRYGIFGEEQKIWEKRHDPKKKINKQWAREYRAWRALWRQRGPVEFAKHVLRIDPITGNQLVLSEDQKEFLLDVSVRGHDLAIISAGRGSGKTFALGVYIAWRIYTFEFYHISSMGGSSEQSEKIRSYISGWIRHSHDLRDYTFKDKAGVVKTHADSSVQFLSCSGTSTRGPHVRDIIVDEEAAGEEAGGTKYIRAALWQGSTSERLHIIKSSTPHYVHGDFLNTWNNAEKLGYKRYRWAVARHISGDKDPQKIYVDMNPLHWFSNVPWSSDDAIQKLRANNSNEEWLVEALGAISIGSGLVFNPVDIDSCVCSRCLDMGIECEPYKEGHCPIVQYFMQLEGLPEKDIPSSTKDALQRVKERIQGIDWGQVAPDDYAIVGRFRNMVFVLEHLELLGQTDAEKLDKAVELAKKWNAEIIRPDPREWAYNNELANRGFAIHELFAFEGGQEKKTYVYTLKKLIERHLLVIPCKFEDLIRSLKHLTYDDKGKIRKKDDHAFDSLIYATSYYGEVLNQPLLSKKEQKGVRLWRKDSKPNIEKERRDLFERKKKKKKEEEDSPYRGGVKIWK